MRALKAFALLLLVVAILLLLRPRAYDDANESARLRSGRAAFAAALAEADLSAFGSVSEDSSVGAFYPCSRDYLVTQEALRRFRRVHPHSPILMVDDVGRPELEAAARVYNATYRRARRPMSSPHQAGGTYLADPENVMEYVRSMAEIPGVRWVTLLEDDAWWVRPFPEPLHEADVVCDSPDLLERLPHVVGVAPPAFFCERWTGWGGCAFRASMLREIARSPKTRSVIMETRCGREDWASDQTLTRLVYAHGGTFADFPGHRTATRFTPKDAPDVVVVHGVKHLY